MNLIKSSALTCQLYSKIQYILEEGSSANWFKTKKIRTKTRRSTKKHHDVNFIIIFNIILFRTFKWELCMVNLSSGVSKFWKVVLSAFLRTKGVLGVFGSKKTRHIWSFDDIFSMFMLELTGDRTFLNELWSALIFSLIGNDPIASVYLIGVIFPQLSTSPSDK